MLGAIVRASEMRLDRSDVSTTAAVVVVVTGAVAGSFYGCKYNRDLGGPCWVGTVAGYFLGGLVGNIISIPLNHAARQR